MIFGLAVVVGLIVGRLAGGSLDALSSTRLRLAPLAVLGLLVQLVLFTDPVARVVGDAGPIIYTASTAAVFVAVLANLRLIGLPIVALGGALNLAAIVANGGFMPADPGALVAAGMSPAEAYSNSAVVADPALRPLTDVYAIPASLPLANVFSAGDVLIAVGVGVAVAGAMRGPRSA